MYAPCKITRERMSRIQQALSIHQKMILIQNVNYLAKQCQQGVVVDLRFYMKNTNRQNKTIFSSLVWIILFNI